MASRATLTLTLKLVANQEAEGLVEIDPIDQRITLAGEVKVVNEHLIKADPWVMFFGLAELARICSRQIRRTGRGAFWEF